MKSNTLFLQCPVRNESVVGAHVYSHSGEYSPQVRDFNLPARGISCQFIRKYRLANHEVDGVMGRGWIFTYAKAIEKEGDDILYHDGLGRIHHFTSVPSKNSYVSPDGLYTLLEAARDTFSLRQRYGGVLTFETPEIGGRLLSIEDRNGNSLRLEYYENMIQILDPLERRIDINLDQNRVVSLSYAGRIWQYRYNDDGCLIEVIQPPTKATPEGPRTRYAYDQVFRISSITDPNNQVYLSNFYDDNSRISVQKHGNGAFTFEYETIGETDLGFPILQTQVHLKNSALLNLKHDAFGHAVERTLLVSAESLSPEDRNGSDGKMVPLITESIFNRQGETVRITYPAGDTISQTYDEESTDPRNRGNVLEVNRTPALDADTDQTELITRYAYEPTYQQVKVITDPRGNTTRFEYDDRGNLTKKTYPAVTIPEVVNKLNGKRTTRQAKSSESFVYNEAGQLIQSTDARGARTVYFYHPIGDPGGAKNDVKIRSLTQNAGGYLARIVRDTDDKERGLKSQPALLTSDYRYDAFGNRTTILDGKGNATGFEYDSNNLVLATTSRKPFGYQKFFQYDANGNLLEAITSFDHNQYDSVKQIIVRTSTTARQSFEYNSLNNHVRRILVGDGRKITHTLVRDANENIVRKVLPMGNAFEYEYDERGLMLMERGGVQTGDESETHHTYTRSGRLRSTVDSGGNVLRYDYDGFNRYKGFADATGTVTRQSLDEMGNVTQIQVLDDRVTMNERGEPSAINTAVLLESRFQYDELNRQVQINRAWIDLLTGKPLGKSQWDGEEGVVSTVIEYDDNNLPSKVYQETGNIISLQYDGVNRPILVNDATGESLSIEYDGNSNPVRIERLGPALNGDGKRFQQTFTNEFDELDRLVTRSLNGALPETVVYNALDHIIEYKNEAEVSAKYLHDGFGRASGQATTAIVPRAINEKQSQQLLVQRVEWDDNNRLVARVNAADHSTKYTYDTLNRLSSISYADGALRLFERDGNGNIFRIVDPNRALITNSFDAQNRLIERVIEGVISGSRQIEKFQYDGLNRLVAAKTDSATTVRRYDSLSRLLEESQSGQSIKYEYDSAGNCVRLIYPSGQEVRKSYDALQRVTKVLDGQANLIAAYNYGSGTQILDQQLGKVLKVAYTYEPGKDRLNSIIYRSVDTGEIIEGSKCRYDAVGNRIEEAQLGSGRNFGERYVYDSANRVVKAQYGVNLLNDSDSPFEQEVLYELSPTGIWQLKTTRDTNGQTLEQDAGAANTREAYLSLGNRHFKYDANGNRIFEENGDGNEDAKKVYRYDYANRLVHVESRATNGQINQIIEYAYDTLNRQVSKRIEQNGDKKEYSRIWDGSQLIEELEDGKLAKSFTYGARINEPLRMTLLSEHGSEDFFYTLNGRNSVTGLVDKQSKLVEAYHYDIFGQPFLSEQNGHDADRSILSTLGNPLLTNAQLYDRDTGLIVVGSASYDATVGRTVSGDELKWGPWADGYELGDDAQGLSGGMSGSAGVSISGKDPFQGGMSPGHVGRELVRNGSWFYDPSDDTWMKDDSGTFKWLFSKVIGLIGKAVGLGAAPAYLLSQLVNLEDDNGGRSRRVEENKKKADHDAGAEGSGGGVAHGGSGGTGGGIGIGGRGGIGGGIGSGGGQSGADSSSRGNSGPPTPAPKTDFGGDYTLTPGKGLQFEGGDREPFGREIGGGVGSGGGITPTGCFIAGTPVLLANGTAKPIETVQIGDYVVSRDEMTGHTSAQRVSRTWIHNVQATLLLQLTNGEDVETTKEHRFFVADQGFIGAGRLALGTILSTQSELPVQVTGMEPKEQSATVYNLEVENFHTYFVGKGGVLVHNLKDDEGKGGEDWDEDP